VTTRWFWVRHGPTHEKAFVGWRDVPADLSDAAALGRLDAYLPKRAVMVASDLIRARDTGLALEAGRDPLIIDAGLREINFGLWDGMRFDDVAAAYPDLSRAYWEDPGDVAPPEGESWNATSARVEARVQTIRAQHPGRDIVAVAHFGVILTQVQRAMGVTPYAALAYSIAPLSVTEITFDGNARSAGAINHCP